MSTTLPLFWHLSSASHKERIDASVKLVGSLEQFQAKFIPKESSDTSEEEGDQEEGSKADGLDSLNAQDVSYSIRRLIRGLASPRESSRLGFAVALTEILSRVETVTCSQIISIILDSSKIQGSLTGQEERDLLFARLFGLTSVIQSGLLVRTTSLPSSASHSAHASSLEGFTETISQLLVLGEKKSWLRESAWWTAGLAIDALNASEVAWKTAAMDSIVHGMFVEHKMWTPEKVALALKVQACRPELDWQKHLSPTFKNAELLSLANLSTLARIMKESGLEDEDASKSALGNWKPQLHFAWDVILDHLLSTPRSPNSTQAPFQDFFRVVVDESLFSSTSSAERKYWGFQIFEKALPRVASDDMPMLFTKNFMRTWINHLSSKDRYLHKAARQVASCIQTVVKNNPTLGFTLILQLTGSNGNRQFDKLTKTKTVESILASMDAQGIATYIDYLLEQVDECENDDIPSVNARRAWVVDQLGALIHNGSIPRDDEWIQSILDWFIVNGLFIVKKKSDKSPYRALRTTPTPAFSDDLRQACRARLVACLADLTSHTTAVKSNDGKTQKLTGVASDGTFWISKALATITALNKDVKHVTLLEELEEDDLSIRTKAQELVQTLQAISEDQQEIARGAELLLMAMVIQQYSSDEENSSTESLEACIEAVNRMFAPAPKKSKKARKSTDEATGESVPEPVDVLVDSIIGFLEQSTAYLRTVANQTFSLISGAVQENTLDLIVSQLERRNPAELVQDDSDDMEDVEEDSVGEEEDSESSSPSDEDDDEEDEDVDEENLQELRRKIEEALKVNGAEAGADGSDDETDEDLMDDDQMMAIDKQLAEVFRSQVNAQKTSKDIGAQREATHFKNRVLDLVDIFIRRQPTSKHTVRLILPLIDLIAGAGNDERQLADKATGLLRNRIGKSKDLPTDADTEEASTILDEIHTRARKARSSELLSTLSQCSLYLSKILVQSKAESKVVEVYRASLVDFVTRKASNLNSAFFQEPLRRFPSVAWSLRSDIISVASQATNTYRQCQDLQLIQVLTNHIPAFSLQAQEIVNLISDFQEAVLDVIGKSCEESVTLSTAQTKDLLKVTLAALRQTKKVLASSGALASVWKPKSWDLLHKKLATCERYKASTALASMSQQIIDLSQESPVTKKSKAASKQNGLEVPAVPAKRKATSGEIDEDASALKAKRKKVKKTKP